LLDTVRCAIGTKRHAEKVTAQCADDRRSAARELLLRPRRHRVRRDLSRAHFERHRPQMPAGLGHERFDFLCRDSPGRLTEHESLLLFHRLFKCANKREYYTHRGGFVAYEYNQIMYRLDLSDPRLSAAHLAK